jgi:hypothetical protein
MRVNSIFFLAALNALVGAAPAAAAWVHRIKTEAAAEKTGPNGAIDATALATDEQGRRAA